MFRPCALRPGISALPGLPSLRIPRAYLLPVSFASRFWAPSRPSRSSLSANRARFQPPLGLANIWTSTVSCKSESLAASPDHRLLSGEECDASAVLAQRVRVTDTSIPLMFFCPPYPPRPVANSLITIGRTFRFGVGRHIHPASQVLSDSVPSSPLVFAQHGLSLSYGPKGFRNAKCGFSRIPLPVFQCGQ